jgi:hypothetical protein
MMNNSGLHGLNYKLISQIYFEIKYHFQLHAFEHLFSQMLLKKPRLPVNEAKILCLNSSLYVNWPNILLGILRSEFIYDNLLFQETACYDGTIPGYMTYTSKPCYLSYLMKNGKEVTKTIHGATTFCCTLKTNDGQIMQSNQLPIQHFLNKITVDNNWDKLENMSVVITKFKKIKLNESFNNGKYEISQDGKFNVIAYIYAPHQASPFNHHAKPIFNEILPNLMASDNFNIRLFCGYGNGPLAWTSLNKFSKSETKLKNSQWLRDQFNNDKYLRQHNLKVKNTSVEVGRTLIDVVIDTCEPTKISAVPDIIIENVGHLQEYFYQSAIDIVVKEEENLVKCGERKNVEKTFKANAQLIKTNTRNWEQINGIKFGNDDKSLRVWNQNDRYKLVPHQSSFSLECK